MASLREALKKQELDTMLSEMPDLPILGTLFDFIAEVMLTL